MRSFGQTLQQDHAARLRATAVATQLGVNPPTEPNKNQKAMHATLGKLSGQAFDRKFASEMVKDHKKEIAEYQKAAKKQGDPAGAYASETFPTVQKHQETGQGHQPRLRAPVSHHEQNRWAAASSAHLGLFCLPWPKGRPFASPITSFRLKK